MRGLVATPVLPEEKGIGGPDRDRTGDLMNVIHGPGTHGDWLSGWLSADCRESARGEAQSLMLPETAISAKLQSRDTIDKLQEMALSELSILS